MKQGRSSSGRWERDQYPSHLRSLPTFQRGCAYAHIPKDRNSASTQCFRPMGLSDEVNCSVFTRAGQLATADTIDIKERSNNIKKRDKKRL